jgi:hypothetical protein
MANIKSSVRANTASIKAVTNSQKTLTAKTISVGSAGKIAELSDVDMGSIGDGKVLTYDAATGKFKGVTPEIGKRRLNELEDLDTSLLAQGAMVIWDDTQQKWIAKNDIQDGTSLNGGRY